MRINRHRYAYNVNFGKWPDEKQTPSKPLSFKGLRGARLAGFEPTAFRLGGGRSILLSYRRRHIIFTGQLSEMIRPSGNSLTAL